MQQLLPLTERVRGALREHRTSDQVRALIGDLELDVERIRSDLEAAKAKAVDPMTSDDAAAAARRLHHDLGFEEERAASSISQLKLRMAGLERQEQRARDLAAYEALKAERAEVLADVSENYTRLAQELSELLARAKAVDLKLQRSHSPEGCERLPMIEWEARERTPSMGREIVPFVNDVNLPRLNLAERHLGPHWEQRHSWELHPS